MSVLRAGRKRKQVRKLGRVDIIRREADADLELDGKVALIRSLVPLGLMHVQELLDQEVTALARARYARKDASVGGRRHGRHPGTVGLAGQRVPIRVPRVRRVAGSEIPLRSYAAMRGDREVDDLLLRRVLYGISCRNYEAAAEAIPGAIGLSSSTVSRGFIQASAAQLRAFQERALSGEDSEPIGGRQPGGRSGRDPDVASIRGVRGVGTVAEDDELSGVCQCARRGTMRQGGVLAELAPTTPLADDRAPGHRTASTQGQGLPPPAHAA